MYPSVLRVMRINIKKDLWLHDIQRGKGFDQYTKEYQDGYQYSYGTGLYFLHSSLPLHHLDTSYDHSWFTPSSDDEHTAMPCGLGRLVKHRIYRLVVRRGMLYLETARD